MQMSVREWCSILDFSNISLYINTVSHSMRLKSRNQIAIISAIVAILATAVIAGSYNVQTVKAAYGNEVIKPNAQCAKPGGLSCDGGHRNWGGAVSDAADNLDGQGIGDFRANGCKSTQVIGGCATVPP
jgi:hypothetical protein